MNKIPATVRVFTFNSGKTLRRCLESLTDFEEILILDGNSTDNTLEIAREYGARIEKQFPDTNQPRIIEDWPELVNLAVIMAKFDWILYIDSDESASSGLVEEIRNIVQEAEGEHPALSEFGQYNKTFETSERAGFIHRSLKTIKHYMYKTPNRIIYKNREILYATPYPGYQYRFFNRKSGALYKGNPHYFLKFDAKRYTSGVLKNSWYVYVDDSDAKIKKIQVLQDALDAKNQNWRQFIRWSVFNKFFGMAKILIKVMILYLRHGFRNTLPPKLELARVKYKTYLFCYIIQQRFFGRDLEKDIARAKHSSEK